MNLVSYLKDLYGYGSPIVLKDIRIGGLSKTAIRQGFYRAEKRGELSRDGCGVYSLVDKTADGLSKVVTFEMILKKKFLLNKLYIKGLEELSISGYYSGLTFLNMIGITQQVPSVIEITTNRTSSNKSFYKALGRVAVIRKSKTEVTFENYKILQFLDMFHFLTIEEVKTYQKLLIKYINDNYLTRYQYSKYIGLYGTKTLKKLVEGGIICAFK